MAFMLIHVHMRRERKEDRKGPPLLRVIYYYATCYMYAPSVILGGIISAIDIHTRRQHRSGDWPCFYKCLPCADAQALLQKQTCQQNPWISWQPLLRSPTKQKCSRCTW